MEGYNTSISEGVLDVLIHIPPDVPCIYTFAKSALQPIRILELLRRDTACSTLPAFLELAAPSGGGQETRQWNGTNLIINVRHLLESPSDVTWRCHC